jgi:hypothetical protein
LASNTNESIAKFHDTIPLREAEKGKLGKFGSSRDNNMNALQDGVAIAAKVCRWAIAAEDGPADGAAGGRLWFTVF